jgi:hypothetical protein
VIDALFLSFDTLRSLTQKIERENMALFKMINESNTLLLYISENYKFPMGFIQKTQPIAAIKFLAFQASNPPFTVLLNRYLYRRITT